MSDEDYCPFCGKWIYGIPHCCEGKYESDMIKAEYETMGWSKEPPLEWNFKLDKTGTKLVPIDEIGVNP